MKKLVLALSCLGSLTFLQAQQVSLKTLEPTVEQEEDLKVYPQRLSQRSSSGSEAIIFTEDFASGIPAGWLNYVESGGGVLLPNGSWEYRGPSTTPSNATGSRGAQAGAGTPLQSPTASNGFIIFDSDYLDDAGIPNNTGNGIAPAPHVGYLITNTIDFTGHPFIELKFNASVRKLDSDFKLGISIDGGTTFADTIDLYPNLAANVTVARNAELAVDISAAAGGQSNVKLAFIFEGLGRGSYYWMMDDIEIRDLPKHEMRFTAAGGAPAHDIIYEGNGANHPKEGHISLQQIVPISFDSNVLNYGVQAQTNVVFKVEIYNSSNTLVNTLQAPPVAVVASGDTIDYNTFFTPQWTPTVADDYTLVYTVTSDSTLTTAPRDSFNLFVTDETSATYADGERLSLDNGVFGNSLGTAQLGNDGSGMAVQIDLSTADAGKSTVAVYGFEIGYSTLTVDGGDILFEVYDTAGFSYTGGFGSSSILSKQFTVDVGSSGTTVFYDITDNGANPPLLLNPDRYFFAVYFFSNGGANEIRIANDQSFASPDGRHAVMYNADDSRFYSGYSNSRNFNAPFIRIYTENILGIGLDEHFNHQLSLYPNPAKDQVEYTVEQGGSYTVEVRNINGQLLHNTKLISNGNQKHTLDISGFARGVYTVKVYNENAAYTNKLIVE
jgi:hypothetical protein